MPSDPACLFLLPPSEYSQFQLIAPQALSVPKGITGSSEAWGERERGWGFSSAF